MRINLKLRFMNIITVFSLALVVAVFIYQILSIIGIAAPVSDDLFSRIIYLIFTVLTAFGVITDPTTSGVSDSDRAMTYSEPM